MDNPASHNDLSLQNLVAEVEKYKQEIFTLKRNENALKIVQLDLSCELDSIHKVKAEELKSLTMKHESMIKNLQDQLSDVSSNYEQQINLLSEEIKSLKDELSLVPKDVEHSNTQSTELADLEAAHEHRIATLKMEHELELKNAIALCQEMESEKFQLTDECTNLKQELECAQQNFNSKKEEVEQLKEQLQELQQELVMLQMTMDVKHSEHEEKGNSLFAEVNDRRLKLEHILRRDRAAFLEMKRQHAESTKENEMISTKMLLIEANINSLLKSLGTEDDQLIKFYENELEDQRTHIRELQKKISILQKEQVQTSSRSPQFLYDVLESTRKDLEKFQSQVEDLCLEKRKLNEMIRNSEKEAQRWQAQCGLHSIDNIKLKKQLAELKVQKSDDEFEDSGHVSSSQHENITKTEVVFPDGPKRMSPEDKRTFTIVNKTKSPVKVRNVNYKFNRPAPLEESPCSRVVKIEHHVNHSELNGAKPSIDSIKTEKPNLDAVLSILKAERKSPLREQNGNDPPPTKGVTFSSNTVSPQTSNLKLRKKAGVAVPVTFVKRDRSKALIIKEESLQEK